MYKYCKDCEREFEVEYNFCPICNKELETLPKVDFEKAFKPYLKGTKFVIEKAKVIEEAEGDICYHFSWYKGKNKEKDTKKLIKNLIKNKPDFLTPVVEMDNICDKLVFIIDFETSVSFISTLCLPVNKVNTELILCLIDKYGFSKLQNNCQEEMDWLEKRLKQDAVILKQYKKLKKQLFFKEEE